MLCLQDSFTMVLYNGYIVLNVVPTQGTINAGWTHWNEN